MQVRRRRAEDEHPHDRRPRLGARSTSPQNHSTSARCRWFSSQSWNQQIDDERARGVVQGRGRRAQDAQHVIVAIRGERPADLAGDGGEDESRGICAKFAAPDDLHGVGGRHRVTIDHGSFHRIAGRGAALAQLARHPLCPGGVGQAEARDGCQVQRDVMTLEPLIDPFAGDDVLQLLRDDGALNLEPQIVARPAAAAPLGLHRCRRGHHARE